MLVQNHSDGKLNTVNIGFVIWKKTRDEKQKTIRHHEMCRIFRMEEYVSQDREMVKGEGL